MANVLFLEILADSSTYNWVVSALDILLPSSLCLIYIPSKTLDTILIFYGIKNSTEIGKIIGAEPIKVQIDPLNCYTNFLNIP